MRLKYHRPAAAAGPRRKSPFAMIVGFLPLIVFALLSNIALDLALWAAFAAAFAVGIRDFAQERMLRLLDTGSTVLFGLLALYAGFIQPGISIEMTRLVVHAAFSVLALVSMLMRNPLTLQYAREQASSEVWATRRFIASNYGLTGFWLFAFAAMAATDALSNLYKNLPLSLDATVGLVLLMLAVGLTARYPAYLRTHAAACAPDLRA